MENAALLIVKLLKYLIIIDLSYIIPRLHKGLGRS